MALTHLLLAISVLALVSLTINGAYAYSTSSVSYSFDTKATLEKPNLHPKQKPEEDKSYIHKPEPKRNISVPKVEKPKGDADYYGHETKPSGKKLNPSFVKPKEEVKELYKSVGVQGIVYCKVGSKLVPLQGAVTRVTCLAVDRNGYESDSFTILSKPCDPKGYFFAALPISEVESKSKLFDCKVFLDSSPKESCGVATDVNKGLSGALPYSSFNLLADKKMKLYSVGPFVYSSAKPEFIKGGN